MPGVVVVGAQWGDEGKGKVVDLMTERADVVVRYGGGPNAGHTLVVDRPGGGRDKVVVRLVPSGVLHPSTRCVLGAGVVVDPLALVEELDELAAKRVLAWNEAPARLLISDRAHLILPYHKAIDALREQGAFAVGTTKRGIGPAYEDKARRSGVHVSALRDVPRLGRHVARALDGWAPIVRALGGKVPTVASVIAEVEHAAARLAPLVGDASSVVDSAIRRGDRVIFEGAQGALLDVDHGTYPYVTSSSAIAGGACTGVGVGPTAIQRVVGITKAYATRVGGGPFPTEIQGEVGERLRSAGAEFGAVTGRPRRCGWLDLPALRYARRINGLTDLAVTKLDVLGAFPTIRICTAYDTRSGRRRDLPIDELASAHPVFEEVEGWGTDLSSARTLDALPRTARAYIERISSEVETPIALVSVGPERAATIVLREIFA